VHRLVDPMNHPFKHPVVHGMQSSGGIGQQDWREWLRRAWCLAGFSLFTC